MSEEKYVIWLSDVPEYEEDYTSSYGYWEGKDYHFDYERFPITDRDITNRTKVYSSYKRAENALKSALSRNYAYVIRGRVEPYKLKE